MNASTYSKRNADIRSYAFHQFSESLTAFNTGCDVEKNKFVGTLLTISTRQFYRCLLYTSALHDKLLENVNYFRDKMTAAGFDIKPTQSAICAVIDVYKRQD